MIPTRDEVDAKKWPSDVREGLNWCIRMLKRPTEIKYGSETIPKWEQADNKEVIVLPLRPGGGSVFQHPLQLIDASNAHDGPQVRVRFGTVNGVMPTGMTEGDDPPFILSSISGDGSIQLTVTTNASGVITAIAITNIGSASLTADTSTTFHLLVGTYSVTGGVVTVADNLTGSQTFSRCRNWFSNPATYSANWNMFTEP